MIKKILKADEVIIIGAEAEKAGKKKEEPKKEEPKKITKKKKTKTKKKQKYMTVSFFEWMDDLLKTDPKEYDREAKKFIKAINAL